MWLYSNDYDKWEKKKEVLNIDDFKYLQQELDSYRLYSKCLSGSSYVPVNDTSNIYDIITGYIPRTWYISNSDSQYSISSIPSQYPYKINEETSDEYYNKYNYEYGLTLKNLFTPERIIKDAIDNFIYVDVCSTSELSDLNDSVVNREIDGVRLKEGHRVLIKDQKTTITLPSSTDPKTFFEGNYYQLGVVGLNINYEYYNSDNGIYIYRDGLLVRENDLDDYDNCVRFSVVSKLGETNIGLQFHMSRLSNGYFPTTLNNEPIEFIEKKNWVIRNKVDYNNLFDINYYDVLKHGTQSYTFEGIEYSIPERTISVGEFGVIINNQAETSNIIRNKYKVNLRSIDQTEKYYWIVGDNGILLKVRKHDFKVERIKVDCRCPRKIVTTNLRSISFFNDLNGVAVGDINTILITKDGGLNWERHIVESFNTFYFNTVIFTDINNFYIGGNNGVFIQFKRDISGWTAYKRRISKFIDDEDEFLLVENINKIIRKKTTSWDLYYRFNSNTTSNDKDLLFIVTNNNNIIVHDIDDSIPFYTDFIFLEFKDKNYTDIKTIETKENSNEFYFTGFDQSSDSSGIFSFNLSTFDAIGIGSSFSNRILSTFSATYESDKYPNSLFDYNGLELTIAGNNSLLQSSTYSATFSFNILDDDFESRLKSKLLFLDYDVASKLNFFTDEGDYRLPNTINFKTLSLTSSVGNFFEFMPIVNDSQYSGTSQSEINWWEYWRDSESTFEYYANTQEMTDSTKVLPSGRFTYDTSSFPITIGSSSISTDIDSIIELAPSLSDRSNSRFSVGNGDPITTPSASYDMYLYDYMMIIKTLPSLYNVGDVIRLECDVLDSYFLVNKVVTIGAYSYIYTFTEFNDQIIESLSTLSSDIKITNLNTFTNIRDLDIKFNLHPISNGYELIATNYKTVSGGIGGLNPINNGNIEIKPKFNNVTSYYNLATNVLVSSDSSQFTYTMEYENSFIKFGYKPTYNIQDYLEYLNDSIIGPKFYGNKEYLAMPVYNNVPLSSGSLVSDKCYIDYNIKNNNKLTFGSDLKFEWESFFINTFIDIKLTDSNSQVYNTDKLLIIDKYYVEEDDIYIIEFHKNIKFGSVPLTLIDINSRRTLSQISDDLQYLNNIQRPYTRKEYSGGTTQSLHTWDVSYQTLEKELNFKVNTDSYAKIFLSDYDTVRSLSGLVYTDYKGDISLSVTQLESENEINILNTSNYSGNLYITCVDRHNLSDGDAVNLKFNGGTGSSQELNNQYFGYHIITKVDDYNFFVDVPYGSNTLVGNDTGVATYIKRDPFLNYEPVDIIDVGVDKVGKISVELTQDNTILTGDIYELVDVDYEKHRFRLIDGLDVELLSRNYSWIYEAEISEAVIGRDESGIVWYKGTWECGRWFGGTWISGSWVSGDWYDGVWKSKLLKDNYLTIDIDQKQSDSTQSIWFSGRWFDGEWEDGTWLSGRWYDGTWNNGVWLDGTWNNGTWKNGQFNGGIWVLGNWESGIFSTSNAPAYWIDGTWLSGDFENGMWFNGVFGTIDTDSRFGTKAYNSRAAIWKSGKWINGSFHSRLNLDEDNNYDVSDIHKYSIWENGDWFSGDFYGGVVYNINFESGTWHGGILEDVPVIGINGSGNYFVIEGQSNFNTGYQISIIDNQSDGPYSSLGSNTSPSSYTVLYSIEDITENETKIYVDKPINLSANSPIDTNLRIVSKFRNCNWKSGIWTNGIYEQGLWEGGIWYNGIFNATWM